MGRTTSCSSSTMDNSCGHHQIVSSSELSYPSHHSSTDLSLALSISASPQPQDNNPSTSREQQPDWPPTRSSREEGNQEYNNNNNCHKSSFQSTTLFVKVYMEGIPIGRKLDLLAHDGYDALISTLDQMFRTNILCKSSPSFGAEADGVESKRCHVLTYEDKEGDWLMVGDVPWEMFLTSARRLRITRNDRF